MFQKFLYILLCCCCRLETKEGIDRDIDEIFILKSFYIVSTSNFGPFLNLE